MPFWCRLGLHRWRQLYVGTAWTPYDYVTACGRCGQEPDGR